MLKKLWKSNTTSSSTTSKQLLDKKKGYRYDSIETQTRLLVDTLFLLMDYESALGMYKLVKDDYKNDKNHLHVASVHEMMTICYYYHIHFSSIFLYHFETFSQCKQKNTGMILCLLMLRKHIEMIKKNGK